MPFCTSLMLLVPHVSSSISIWTKIPPTTSHLSISLPCEPHMSSPLPNPSCPPSRRARRRRGASTWPPLAPPLWSSGLNPRLFAVTQRVPPWSWSSGVAPALVRRRPDPRLSALPHPCLHLAGDQEIPRALGTPLSASSPPRPSRSMR